MMLLIEETDAPEPTEEATETVDDASDVDADPVDLAIADLAERLYVSPNSIDVVSAEAITWPDGSLGCPEPGMAYTMALVEGYQVKLRVGEQIYDYHGNNEGHIFLCGVPLEPDTLPNDPVQPVPPDQ